MNSYNLSNLILKLNFLMTLSYHNFQISNHREGIFNLIIKCEKFCCRMQESPRQVFGECCRHYSRVSDNLWRRRMANTFQFSVANIFHPIETGGGDNGFISRPISVPRFSTWRALFVRTP